MTEPTVCAVMLTADRPEMARRAAEAFMAQTYAKELRRLLVWETHDGPLRSLGSCEDGSVFVVQVPRRPLSTIGSLRNEANAMACPNVQIPGVEFDIIIHFDDDDYSHPNRIAEQVALLQSSGAEAVGYREMLFWRESVPSECESDTPPPDLTFFALGTPLCGDPKCNRKSVHYSREYGCRWGKDPIPTPGEAWLYSNGDPRYCLGTSLCYWRTAWERRPFEPTSQGEDARWMMGVKSVGISSLVDEDGSRNSGAECNPDLAEPRMIARIHAGNTSNAYDPQIMRTSSEWRRAPEWDGYCRGVMER